MDRFPVSIWALSVLVLCALFMPDAFAARHALVIGNDNYQTVPKLRNAVADADAMGKALRAANYEVTMLKNRELRQMMADVRRFKAKLQGGDEVVFFFAGHGVQIGAVNYLLPVDLQSESEDQVRDESIALSRILEDLREQKPALVMAIIDACRDNPFTGTGRSIGGRGLTGVAGATGQMVIYSAGEGQKALDSLGKNDSVRNGVFTRVFVKEMSKPGLSINQIVRNVRSQVNDLARKLNHEQVPAIYDQVLGTFYFVPRDASAGVAAAEAIPEPARTPASQDLELSYWNSVKDSRHDKELEAYLARFPDGRYAEPARARIATLARVANVAAQRPTLPFAVSEEVWAVIENSEAYAKAVAAGPAVATYRQTIRMAQGDSETAVNVASHAIDQAAPAYTQKTLTHETSAKVLFRTYKTSFANTHYFALGFLPLGNAVGAQITESVTRVSEISGSLFPMREGAELSMAYRVDNKLNYLGSRDVKLHCTVAAAIRANTVRADFPGNAWPVDCITQSTSGGQAVTTKNRSFYLEDYRVMSDMISVIATMPGEHGADVIPASSHDYTVGDIGFAIKNYQLKFGH